MGFLQAITDFFESVFMSSSPEVHKKQELKKLDAELRNYRPVLYKNGMLQANMAELFRILYENTKPIDDILSETISGEDLQRNSKFADQLILTGFTGGNQEKLESLSYENRKKELLESGIPANRIFDSQHRTLEALVKELNSPEFVKIDQVLAEIQQLTDICRFNFLTAVRAFDNAYNGLKSDYKPMYQQISPDVIESTFLDLYYVTATFKMNASLGRAVLALAQLRKGSSLDADERDVILDHLSKINGVFSKVLTPDILKKFVCLVKKDTSYASQTASYKADARQRFAAHLEQQFETDENRMKIEIKDQTIQAEVNQLFDGRPLEVLNGYNADTNMVLRQNTSVSFLWLTPMQIIKTFMKVYFSESIQTLLNDIVIEGFFNNSTYKSEFSSTVYSCTAIKEQIAKFEKSFEHGGENDQAVMLGFIRDSHKDADFVKKLMKMVDTINGEVKQIIQDESTNLYSLYLQLGELLTDAKKPNPDTISNIKVLMTSSRNRDNSEQLEQQYGSWKEFFEIMKNYAIIGDIEKKS